ncbi:DUF4157 domain-containing protein [Synechococcus sp. PCC 7336]|uniref:eCIS core domain-containing protein n=1 Tax=Synechococcus sp. PCC 7336 TaxID=195250 RepID=UPI00034501B9|nr:DUF4157 domain-containing protein [Synechococcus sp. PCC 7336]
MRVRQYWQREATPKSTATPQSNPLATRPFAPQPQPEGRTASAQSIKGDRKSPAGFGYSVSTLNLGPYELAPPLQTKLSIGVPGDKYEREADRVAKQVVSSIHSPQTQISQQGGSIQRETLEDDDELRMKPLQRQLGAEGAISPELEREIERSRGGGHPLSEVIRTPMEQAFGADFSGVRVHTDGRSNQLNRSIQAKAFTTNRDVFFRAGAYNPATRDGRELIAHELTHVLQQQGGRAAQLQQVAAGLKKSTIQRQGGYIPTGDGPYGHNFTDGASTAGAGFGQQLKDDIYDLNANGVTSEMHELTHIDDDDDETMLTRDPAVVAQVDHIYPANLGGSSSHRNAQIISQASNNYKSNTYPTDGIWSGGCTVLMGHKATAMGNWRGEAMSFDIPAYETFPVTGKGPAAKIDMSGTALKVTRYQQDQTGTWQPSSQKTGPGANDVTPQEARDLGILPKDIPDPQQ